MFSIVEHVFFTPHGLVLCLNEAYTVYRVLMFRLLTPLHTPLHRSCLCLIRVFNVSREAPIELEVGIYFPTRQHIVVDVVLSKCDQAVQRMT